MASPPPCLGQRAATVAADRGFTETQQLLLDLGSDARRFELARQAAGILRIDSALPGDVSRNQRMRVRMGVHEQKNPGMPAPRMRESAQIMATVLESDNPASLTSDVAALMNRYPPK